MSYLYGDSTPFPLDENFIETIRALIEACVALLEATERMEACRDIDTGVQAEEELARQDLEGLGGLLQRVISDHPEASQSHLGEVTAQLSQAIHTIIEDARVASLQRAEAARHKSRRLMAEARNDIHGALGSFFVQFALPATRWAYHWRTDAAGQATATANSMCGASLAVTLDVDIRTGHVLGESPKLSEVVKEVTLSLPAKGGWLRRSKLKKHALDNYFVTEVIAGETLTKVILSKNKKRRSAGYAFTWHLGDTDSHPTVKPLDESGTPQGEELVLHDANGRQARRVLTALASATASACTIKRDLVSAQLDGVDVRDLPDPARFAVVMIDSVAALVREIRQRSTVPGELVLKRHLDDGKREEVYVPRQRLAGEINRLQTSHVELFAPFALTTSTGEQPEVRFSDITTDVIDDSDDTQPPKLRIAGGDPE